MTDFEIADEFFGAAAAFRHAAVKRVRRVRDNDGTSKVTGKISVEFHSGLWLYLVFDPGGRLAAISDSSPPAAPTGTCVACQRMVFDLAHRPDVDDIWRCAGCWAEVADRQRRMLTSDAAQVVARAVCDELERRFNHAREALAAYHEASRVFLEDYEHEEGCPCDDTCQCPDFVALRLAQKNLDQAMERP